MDSTRPPAVAGAFYSADAETLTDTVKALLDQADPLELDLDLRALIVPHAGYIYSGPVAASAYRLMAASTALPQRVVLLGPSHYLPFSGIAAPGVGSFQTPLGTVAIDTAIPNAALTDIAVHRQEHSLEVQLPFLQVILGNLTILPLLTGRVAPAEAAAVLEDALNQTDGFGVISSDLSHYLDYETARSQDQRTANTILELRSEDLQWDDACGVTAVQAALLVARRRGWHCRLLDLRNSGDTAGDKTRVVGYGAFALGPPA